MSDVTQKTGIEVSEWALAPLDRKSPLPLYAQIKQRLVGMILSWEDPERRFYSDEELCALFSVSRDTVRQALSELAHEGLLTRSRGLGTFVAARKLEERFSPGMDFKGQWANGTEMQVAPLVFERRAADTSVAAALEVEPGREVLFIKRVRSAASVPIAVDYRYLLAELVEDWEKEASLGSPLHRLWRTCDLSTGEFVVEAGIAGPEEVEYLHLSIGAPVMIRSLRYRDEGGRFVMAGHTVHRGDLVRYSMSVPLSRDASGPIGDFDQSGVHDD